MAPSRYYDKALACDLYIITSPYNPLAFFWAVVGRQGQKIDSFDQLRHRITLAIEMMPEAIYCTTFWATGKGYGYKRVKGSKVKNTHSAKARRKAAADKAPIDEKELFNHIFNNGVTL